MDLAQGGFVRREPGAPLFSEYATDDFLYLPASASQVPINRNVMQEMRDRLDRDEE